MSPSSKAIARLDPRIKIVLTLLFILSVVLTPPERFRGFIAYLVMILALILLARVPVVATLRRSLVVLPFVLLVGLFIPFLKGGEPMGSYSLGPLKLSLSRSGLLVLWNIAIKAWLSALATILLLATTGLMELLRGLEGLRVPRILVLLLSFLLRYLPLFASQAIALRRAIEARSGGKSRLKQLSVLGNLVGTLFIRSYERGERIYNAMLARGFSGVGTARARALALPPPAAQEILVSMAFLGLLIAVWVITR